MRKPYDLCLVCEAKVKGYRLMCDECRRKDPAGYHTLLTIKCRADKQEREWRKRQTCRTK